MFLFLKTDYFHLGVLCQNDFRISYFRNNGEIIRILHVSCEEKQRLIIFINEIKVQL